MNDISPPQRETPDSLMLYGFWYRALPSRQVRGDKLSKAMLLETPLAIGRDRQGRPFALHDACPHRGMPLSCGDFDGQQVECSYHGWRFDGHTGQCQLIPSLTADQKLKIDRIYAGSYACEEHDDFIWVFIPEPPAAWSRIHQSRRAALSRAPGSDFQREVQTGLPDRRSALHRRSRNYRFDGSRRTARLFIRPGGGGQRDSIHEKHKNFEPIPNGFRMSAHTPSSNSAPYKLLRLYADAESITTTIDFVLPNLRLETIRAGKYWFSSLTTVTPITRNHCRIDVVAAWNLFRWVPFGPAVAQVCFCEVCGTGPADDGTAVRRAKAQSAPDADRRCRPSRQVVFRIEGGLSGSRGRPAAR